MNTVTEASTVNHPVVARDQWIAARAPLAEIERFRQRMGWQFKWVSSHANGFNFDFGVSFTPQEKARNEVTYA